MSLYTHTHQLLECSAHSIHRRMRRTIQEVRVFGRRVATVAGDNDDDGDAAFNAFITGNPQMGFVRSLYTTRYKQRKSSSQVFSQSDTAPVTTTAAESSRLPVRRNSQATAAPASSLLLRR